MIIIEPPYAVDGAANLSKGQKVFDVVYNANGDTLITLDLSVEPIIGETLGRLRAVHDRGYINRVWDGEEPNGYGVVGPAAYAANVHSVHSCAIMREAARLVLKDPSAPVFAPVSGFHHSGWNFGGGYCTFNGLVLAAREFKFARPDAKVLIIDGDGHFGDGTQNIIEHLDLKWLDQCSLDKYTVGGDSLVANKILLSFLRNETWDFVIYQAGADSHKDDPYQAGYLTDAEWQYRDRIVFEHCKDNKIPLVFCLAGGYNAGKTILLHSDTVTTARKVYERTHP
jgi:acetoin utilization deacetylase AcuC-like enzyme